MKTKVAALALIGMVVMLACSAETPTPTITPAPATPEATVVAPTPTANPTDPTPASTEGATPELTVTPSPPTDTPTPTPEATSEASGKLVEDGAPTLLEAARQWREDNESVMVDALVEAAWEKLPPMVVGDLALDHVKVMVMPPDKAVVYVVKIVEHELPLGGTQQFHISGDVVLTFEDYTVVDYTLERVAVEREE